MVTNTNQNSFEDQMMASVSAALSKDAKAPKKFTDRIDFYTGDQNVVYVNDEVKNTAKKKLEEIIRSEIRMVKGQFKCLESPGTCTKIVIRKYPGIPPFVKTMEDGKTYEVPLYVARYLNGFDVSANALNPVTGSENLHFCQYPVHTYKHTGPMPIVNLDDPYAHVVPKKWQQRYAFLSLDFGMGMVA